jgi:hypothetical protein
LAETFTIDEAYGTKPAGQTFSVEEAYGQGGTFSIDEAYGSPAQTGRIEGNAFTRVYEAGRQTVDEIFAEPLGVSRETLGPLVNQNVEQAQEPVWGQLRAFNDVLIRGTAAAGDVAFRGVSAVFQGGIAAATQALKEFGVSDTKANQFMRDANVALIALGVEFPTVGVGMIRSKARPPGGMAKPAAKAGEKIEPTLEGLRPASAADDSAAPKQLEMFDEAIDRAVKELPAEQQAAARAEVKSALDRSMGEGAETTGVSKLPEAGLTEPRITGAVSKKVVDAAEELLTVGGVRRDPSLLISDQIMDLLSSQRLTTTDISSILNKHGLSHTDFADLWRVNIKKAAQDMRTLSILEQRVKALAGEAGAEADLIRLQDEAGVSGRALGWWRRIDNVRRGMLVTQLSTAVRNFETQTARLGVDAMTNALDAGMRKVFAPNSTAAAAPDAMEALMRVFVSPRKTKQQVDAILSAFPKEQDRLFLRYASDINAAGGGKVFGHAETVVNALNIANRFQEYLIRRAVFASSLNRRLGQDGISLEGVIKNNSRGLIQRQHIEGAVNDALEATFGKDFSPMAPGFEGMAGTFIRTVNKWPGLTFAIPFPRFMMNAVKYQFEYSPLGFMKLLGKEERAKVAAGDMATISKATMGSALLLAAYQIRNSEFAGERWYEIRTPDGKYIDARAFNPFAGYLFIADLVDRIKDDRLDTLSGDDIIKGILSANVRAGTGLFILDQLTEAMAGLPTNTKVLQDFAGSILAGFAVPLNQIKDLFAEFDQNEAVIRSAREGPYWGVNIAEAYRNMPIASTSLPAAYSPLREGPLTRDFPLTRQLTGLLMTGGKNPVEMEVDRLGMPRAEFYPRTGDPTADREVVQIMGILSERGIAKFVQSPQYLRLGNRTKSYVLAELLKTAKRAAYQAAKARNPLRFAKVQAERMSQREQRMLDEVTSGRFTELSDNLAETAEQQ